MGINQLGTIAVTHITDWGRNTNGNKIKNGKDVSDLAGVYLINGGNVMINSAGPPVRVRYCSPAICDINFWADDGILLADDPTIQVSVDTPPIAIEFANPVTAVGAYVSAIGPAVVPDMQVQAVMWIKVSGDANWYPVSAVGKVGTSLAKGATATAPFVGASADGGQLIEQVRFDASLAVNFQTLALSKLYWG